MGISASVTNNQITASVGETQIDVSVSGGVGPTGTAGAAATITVGTVTTGAAGSSASVVNAGSTSAAVLNFTIPAGATGPQGATGATGAAGSNASATTDASALVTGTLPDARLSSNIARTSDVSSAVAAVVNAAPASLDTLKELATALGNDASFATTVTNSLAAKAPLASPTFTGTVSGVTKAMVGLGSVDNTSDAAKPISTATQTALDAKAATSHAHTVSAITDAGTAATRNVPVTGNASSTQVVVGSDTRLTDSRTPTAHNQAWSTITSTPTTLAGYGITDAAAASHTHSLSSITQSSATTGQVPQWSGTAWVAATPATYSLPVATSSVTGGVRIGSGVSIDGSGVISVSTAYAATSHAHGNISSAGLVNGNTSSGQIVVTTTGGALTTASSISSSQVSGLGSLATQSSVAWSAITDTPTTLAGYGITDGGGGGGGGVDPTAPLTCAKLTVLANGGAQSANGDGNACFVLDNGSNATNAWFNFNGNDSDNPGTNCTLGFTGDGNFFHGITYVIPENRLTISPNGANGYPEDGLTVDASGYVGIGTIAPSEMLEVSGNIKAVSIRLTALSLSNGIAGDLRFYNGHFYGYTGSQWKQLDN